MAFHCVACLLILLACGAESPRVAMIRICYCGQREAFNQVLDVLLRFAA
jgi:hypothetical protein